MEASILNVPWFFERFRNVMDGGQLAHLRNVMSRIPHDSLLDIGCGIGSFSAMTDRRYVGVDIEPRYVDYATKRYGAPNREFVVADALNLDASRIGTFDVVSFINVIHHLTDAEFTRLLTNLRSVEPKHYLIVDVAREKGGPALELFRRLDRGAFFRTSDAQKSLLASAGCRVEWTDVYWSTSRIYPHSVIAAATSSS